MDHFYYLRHGQTTANAADKRSGGEDDVSLTSVGRKQIRRVARFIQSKNLKPGFIASGTLQRLFTTVEILNELLKLPVIQDPNFNERLLGSWNGLSHEETEEWLRSGSSPPGGEDEAVFRRRIITALKYTVLPRRSEKILLVSSRGVARIVSQYFRVTNFYPPKNGELLRIGPDLWESLYRYGEKREPGPY